jgi:hypothetical protein
METKDVQAWMEGYIKAWNSNDPKEIGRLFASDGRYYTAPFREPWVGRDGIVSGWLEIKDEPDDFDFRYEIMGLSGSKGFVRGWTTYHKPPEKYSNLWTIQLNDRGECEEFIEWWMKVD